MKRYKKHPPVKQTPPTRDSIGIKTAKYFGKHPEWCYKHETEKVMRQELGHGKE